MKKPFGIWVCVTFALLTQFALPVSAEQETDHVPIEERRLIQPKPEGVDAESLLPARPEPEDLIKAKVERKLKRIKAAERKAQEEADRLMSERAEAWEAAFPIVDGDSKEAVFINDIAKDSVEVARDADLYPSVLIAQAGLESGWGKSGLTVNHHNLFGIKGAFNGESANLKTWEDIDGQAITIHAGFRSYPSVKASIVDYAQLLKNGLRWSPEFYQGTWRSETDSYKDVTAFLQGRYATDTRYTSKLNDLIDRYDLTRFDDVEEEETDEIVVEPVVEKEKPLRNDQYLVKEGDTVQLILLKFDLALEDFLQLNDMTEARVHVNQVLTVQSSDDQDMSLSGTPDSHLSEEALLAIKYSVKGGR